MFTPFSRSRRSLFSWFHNILRSKPSASKKRRPGRRRPGFELLEDRLAPASLTDKFGALTIILDNPGENLTIAATSANNYHLTSSTNTLFNAGLTGATYTGNATSGTLAITFDSTISIVDNTTATSVTFNNSGAVSYDQPFSIALANPLSGVITFNGTSTFASGLNASTANGNIVAAAGSTINVTSGNLSLTTAGNISLTGAVNVSPGGSTSLNANGPITANNAANNFGDFLDLFGQTNFTAAASASVTSSGALELDGANIAGALTLSAGGAITQSFFGTVTVGGASSFSTTTGSITLDNDNNFGGAVSATVHSTDNVTLGNDNFDTGGIILGAISMGSGTLQVDDFSFASQPSISQTGAITTTGNVTINLSASSFTENVDLNGAANNIAGTVTVNGSFQSGDFRLRNAFASASIGQLSINNFSINSLELDFDNAAIDIGNSITPLPGGSVDLIINAGGNITQSSNAILGFSGNVVFNSTGGDVLLDNSLNSITGDISASVTGTHNITLGNNAQNTILGNISLVSGNLQLDDFSNIGVSMVTEDPLLKGISMKPAVSSTATLNIVNDATADVDLTGAANNFASGVHLTINGTGLGTAGNLGFRNASPTAALNQVTLTNFTIEDFALEFDLAAIDVGSAVTPLPAFSGNLTVTAGGNITQSTNALAVTGNASFTVLGNHNITLNKANNISGAVSFDTSSGTGNVIYDAIAGITLGTSNLGTGTFSVTAGGSGNITDIGGSSITQAPGASPGSVTFTAGPTGTTIDLSFGTGNFFTGPLVFAGAAVTTVKLEDANPKVSLASLTLPASPPLTDVTLIFDGDTAAIQLPPASSLAFNLSLIETNDIVLPAANTFTVTGNHNLTLESTHGSIRLYGQVNVGGTGTTTLRVDGLSGNGQVILANNASNVFGTLILTNDASSSSNTIVSSGSLQLGNVDILDGGLSVTAGSISQAGGTSISAASSFSSLASFTATTGSILLTNTTNQFDEPISASVTGSNPITLDNASLTTTIDTIAFGSGAVTINDDHVGGNSIVTETASNGISGGGGAFTLDINITNDATANVDFSAGMNNLPAGSQFHVHGIGGGTTGDLGFRNINPGASLSQIVLPSFSIKSLKVVFDTTSIDVANLPAFSLSGDLTLVTNGNITESGASTITTSGNASFTIGAGIEGAAADGSITLTNINNKISGTVSFANPTSDNKQSVQFTNATDILLGLTELGLGSFTLTATGNIIQVSTIQQALGGGAVTLNASGDTISLANGSNEFSGPVTFNGTGTPLATVGFANNDPLATLPTLTGNIAPSFSSVTYNLAKAPILLPSINTGTLTLSAGGNITQASGTSLTVTGELIVQAGNFGIQLSNAGNSIAEASLNNSGQNAVSLTTTTALLMDDSNLGCGALTISAGGAITQTGGFVGIQQNLGPNDTVAGAVKFTAGTVVSGSPILLDNINNQLLGPVSFNTTGAGGNVTLVNTNFLSAPLILGNDVVGGGFSVTSSGSVSQAAGTSMQVTGGGFFSAGNGAITLTNAGNSIGGSICLVAGGSASVNVTGNAQLAVSTVNGQLHVTSGGNITQLLGLSPSSTNGVLNAQGGTFTTTNNGNITLTNSGNNFNDVPVSLLAGTGTVSLTDSDSFGLALGPITFGAGGLALTVSGPVFQSGGAIVGTGPVSITNSSLLAANAVDVTLDQPGNNLSDPSAGAIAFTNVGNVNFFNQGNIEFTGTSTIGVATNSFDGNVSLVAGGQVMLPNGNAGTLTVGSLDVSANQLTVGTNITTTSTFQGIHLNGGVTFTAPATLDASASTFADISFIGNVTSGVNALTFNVPDSGFVTFTGGVWNQAANMTINGSNATFEIASDGTFKMAGGTTLTLNGMANGSPSSNNNINVDGTFDAEGAATISDGGSDSIIHVNFAGGSTFLVNLATTGALTLDGLNASNQINLAGGVPGVRLEGSGGAVPAGPPPTILTVNNGGNIVGQFGNPQDATGDVFIGTDIVKPTYATTTVKIAPTASGPNSFTGNEPDGDIFMVAVTGGAQVVGIQASTGTGAGALQGLAVVVRNASVATTLTITTTANGGDGFTQLIGLGFDGGGAVTISAAKSNLLGDIIMGGALTSLSLHDWNGGALTAGGTSAGSTTITGDAFAAVSMTMGTKLNTLTVAAYTSGSIQAASFGTITANGNANQPGNFAANLITTPGSPPVQGVLSATIKGTLSGNWDIAGNVGAVMGLTTLGVTAASTSSFSLGLPNGPGVFNAGLVNNITFLTLGTTSNFGLNAMGTVTTLTFVSLSNFSTKVIQANAFTTITTTGSSKDHGNLFANITATGNTGATHTAIGTLKVAGNLGPDSGLATILVANGNIGTITVGRTVQNITINALTTAVGGAITTITDGAWNSATLNAKSVTTWTTIGNLAAQLFGAFTSGTVHLTGTPGSSAATLGTFSTTSDMTTGSSFTIDNGGVTSIAVGGRLADTNINLASLLAGLGTITAAQWDSVDVTARSIGTLKSTGRAAALAATAAFNGDINDSAITTFGTGTTIATFLAAGNLSNTPVQTNGSITSFSVGRQVSSSQISTNLNGNGGGIGTLTAGAWTQSDIAATTLGTVSINGFFTPEQSGAFVNGDFSQSNVVLTGGITSMTVTGGLFLTSGQFFNVPGGIGTLKVTGSVIGSGGITTFALLNRLSPGASVLGTFSAGNIQDVTLYANQAGSITSSGNISDLNLAVASFKGAASFSSTSATPVGISTLSAAGNMDSSTIDVKDTITTFSVGKTLSGSRIAAAFDRINTNAAITTLTAGRWSFTDLNANSIGTFNVTGNANAFLAGNMDDSRINLMGALAGVALGTFKATGTLFLNRFQITSGNVTSFTTAFFKESFLAVGYRLVDFANLFGDTANNQTSVNWEGNFTVGSFTTTAMLSSDVLHSAGFQTSGIVAAKLGTISLSGLNPTSLNPLVSSFGVGFRTAGGAAGTLKINGVVKPNPTTVAPNFKYGGLAG
jgi:hypothetical protein